MALFIYGVASNYGKDFFTAQDRQNFFYVDSQATFG
jgi:hypothetical protein